MYMLMSEKISSNKEPFVRDEITLKRLESYREQYWSDEKQTWYIRKDQTKK